MADISFNKASSAYQNSSNLPSSLPSSLQSVKNIAEMQSDALQGKDAQSKVGAKPSFEDLLGQSLDNARDAGYKGEAISAEAVAGKAEYHELIAAVNNSDLTLRTVVAVRDRIINAYQDILKMPI